MARSTKWIVALALTSSALACNALFGDTAQCDTAADCSKFGASYVCGAGGTCVASNAESTSKPTPTTPGPSSSTTPPATDAGGQSSTPASLASITITPATATVPPGGTQQFTATGKDAAG